MTQNTKNLLMLGGLVIAGYFIYKQINKPKNFSNYVDDDFFNYVDDDFFNFDGGKEKRKK